MTQTPLLFQGQRYKIKSNSQLKQCDLENLSCCCFKGKDTKLKAIHNSSQRALHKLGLLFQGQRYKIKSNSQPTALT